MKTSQSSSIEHSEKQPPHNSDLARQKDKLKLDTHDTLMSSNDPAGLFSENSVPSIPTIPHNSTPAVDNHRSDADVWNLNQLHKADNCSNCGKFVCGKCKVHKYSMPYLMIECEQWEYRGKKA